MTRSGLQRWIIVCALLLPLGTFTVSTADAQCTFNSPGKAKKLITDMVRVYASCGGSVTFPAPNTATELGVPACTPPFRQSPLLIDDTKGNCNVKAKAKLERPCKDLSGDDCVNVQVKAKCKGLLQSDGITPVTSSGWELFTLVRATFDDPVSGDMTVINFPGVFTFPPAKNGKIKLKSDTNSLLAGLFAPGANLPDCTQLELESLVIRDPDGFAFASVGVGARP